MSKTTYLTQEGIDKLKAEIEQLEKVERPKLSAQIGEARDKGDLSENAEYDAAKEAQGMTEMKISQLKETLRFARLVDESKIDTSSVHLLNTVKIKNTKTGATMEYTIVPEREVNLKEKKISVETPIAKGLMGKKKGETAEINIPAGKITLEILDISFSAGQ
ncbi:MAG: transcription elongation factor GreA [Bacteroidota bacterium]|nr:transcription elongation factor GreA [Bacteroidota bacterium]